MFERRAPDFGIRGIHISCSTESSDAFATAAQLLRSERACTAAITTSWQFPGVLSALRAADLRVPDDFSIVSILASQFAEMLAPSLTGVEWPAFDAGRMAAEMLIEQLTGQKSPARQHLISADTRRQRIDRSGPSRPNPNRAARVATHAFRGMRIASRTGGRAVRPRGRRPPGSLGSRRLGADARR